MNGYIFKLIICSEIVGSGRPLSLVSLHVQTFIDVSLGSRNRRVIQDQTVDCTAIGNERRSKTQDIYTNLNERSDISIMAFPLDTVRIYPPIGIARVGNSELEDGWFYGPEVPGHFEEPVGGFKDVHGAVKRQVKHSILSVMLYDLSTHFIFFS